MSTVLVVDDSPPVVDLLSLALSGEGHAVVTAGDGLAGLQAVERSRPDLVLLDLDMPVMDGIEMLERLREQSSVPVIVLTARAGQEDHTRCLHAGANGFMRKPFLLSEVVGRVDATLRAGTRS